MCFTKKSELLIFKNTLTIKWNEKIVEVENSQHFLIFFFFGLDE